MSGCFFLKHGIITAWQNSAQHSSCTKSTCERINNSKWLLSKSSVSSVGNIRHCHTVMSVTWQLITMLQLREFKHCMTPQHSEHCTRCKHQRYATLPTQCTETQHVDSTSQLVVMFNERNMQQHLPVSLIIYSDLSSLSSSSSSSSTNFIATQVSKLQGRSKCHVLS